MRQPQVILASASPRRRDLLTLVGIAHEVRPADLDESRFADEAPPVYAERLARAKASAVATVAPDAVVIGADTIVVVDGAVLGKPTNEEDAAGMLRALSGRVHSVFTAVAVARGGAIASEVEKVQVTIRRLSDDEIRAYIATGEPMDKAGAYGIQGFGATIVERVEGDYFSVMGLGLRRVVALLGQLGLQYDFRHGVVDPG
ncbi:MAG: Maf family protein [Gemmatimonadetes bacterium]|nr:Maf family protein [Gemmatimonadota bacterium]